MDYVDIAVRISPGSGAQYRVAVTTPQGSCESTLELPFELANLAGVVSGVAQTMRDISRTPVATGPNARELGAQLYRSLFHGNVASLLDRTDAVVRGMADTGIRIRLSMDMHGTGMAEVSSLPWELIAATPTDLPLVMSKRTVLVRSPDVLKPTDRIPFQPPLRILAVVSNPRGTSPLDLEEERVRITENWGRLPGVRVDFARPVVSELLEKLASADYHVMHYMGHGDFDVVTGRGALLLEKEDGSADPVDGERLQVLLADEPLRLVFLNACKTGTTSARSGFDPFAGIATSLIKAGVPAVVAMQFPISDRAAISFADTFYQRIAQGFPVDAAVAEGRKALWGGDQSEWATPVLFLRSSDGVLFERSEIAVDEDRTPAKAQVQGAGPVPVLPTGPDDPWGAGEGSAFRIFLATPNETLRPTHRQLMAELGGEPGVRVVGSVPPPFEDEEHASSVQALVRRADLCIHLLGDRPGEPLDETSPGRTYSLEQLRIGLEAANAQLVLLPEHLEIASIQDPEYATFLRTLIERPRDTERFELVRIGRHQMKEEILAKRRRLDEARRAQAPGESGGVVRTAFVDLHWTDLQHATDLIGYLGRRNISPIMMPSSDNSPTEALSLFEENLSKVPLFIVVFGGVTREWVVSRLTAAVQFVTTHNSATRIGVYLAPPVKGTDLLRFPPFYDVAANMTGFDASSIDALIARAEEMA
jgi:hypothetical protein